MLSLVGDGILQCALPFIVLEVAGTATAVGIVQAARWLPVVMLTMFGGVLADRRSRKTLIVQTDAIAGAAVLMMGALLLNENLNVIGLAAASAVLGACSSVRAPALGGIVLDMVPADQARSAVSWNNTSQGIAVAVGPVIGGLVVVVWGSATALFVDSATFFVAILLIAKLVSTKAPPRPDNSFADSARSGLRYVRERAWIWSVTSYLALHQLFFLSTIYVLGPVWTDGNFGSSSRWGVYLAALGVGGIAGSWLPTRVVPRRPLFWVIVGLGVSPIATLLMISPSPLIVVAAGFGVSGASMAFSNTLWIGQLTTSVPATHLSRVLSIQGFGTLLFKPVGQVAIAFVATAVTVKLTILMGAVITIALCIAAVTVVLKRYVDGREINGECADARSECGN